MCGSDIFLGILALVFPPLPVWIKRGMCSADSLINIALCCLGVLPGLIHSWYIISVYPDPTYEEVQQDPEDGRVTYYYVQQGAHPSRTDQRSYGTLPQQQGNVPPQQYRQDQQPPSASRSDEVPPTYAEAVKGNHKIQTQD